MFRPKIKIPHTKCQIIGNKVQTTCLSVRFPVRVWFGTQAFCALPLWPHPCPRPRPWWGSWTWNPVAAFSASSGAADATLLFLAVMDFGFFLGLLTGWGTGWTLPMSITCSCVPWVEQRIMGAALCKDPVGTPGILRGELSLTSSMLMSVISELLMWLSGKSR